MENLRILSSRELSSEAQERMEKGFAEHEKEHDIQINYSKVVLTLVDKQGTPLGALIAFTWYAEIYVDDLWIDKSIRGRGYGRKLINQLEQHFHGKGYNNINLVTNGFQAPDFYKKCRYQIEFVRENKTNPQLTKTFFVKYF
jgi:GNAT superfamily N-acetyltransferase